MTDNPAQPLRARLIGVSKSYVSGLERQTVLRDVDLDLAPGSLTVLHGPSGSGKSTLLHMLGLLDRPDAGTIEIDRKDVSGYGETARAKLRNRAIGFIFQSADLIPKLSAAANVRLPLEIGGVARAEADQRARAMLERLGLGGLGDRSPERLSGGQCQRVAVARALVGEPSLLIADEPTSNLDTDNAIGIMEVIQGLCHDLGTAAIVATHDTRLLSYCDRAVGLEDGRIGDGLPTGE